MEDQKFLKLLEKMLEKSVAVSITSQRLQASNIRYDFYTTSVILERVDFSRNASCISNNYGKLQSAFDKFQKILK